MTATILRFFDDSGYEKALDTLAPSRNHIVLRKVSFPKPRQISLPNLADSQICRGIYLDTETTGVSHNDDEVIQICMLPFIYTINPATNHFQIIGVYTPYIGFREPSEPISQEIVDLTGITMDMLKGQSLDIEKIDDLLEKTDFIIAHNAAFDRPFTHGISDKFIDKKWACSMSDVPWRALGFESLKLSHLAADLGFFFEPHQADKDCLAGLAVLAQGDKDGESYFHKMITAAEKDSITMRAENAPFEAKDILKARGYSWKDGSDGSTKGWEISVPIDNADEERDWLSTSVYNGRPRFSEKIESAVTRFTGP